MVDPVVVRNIDTRQTFPNEQHKKKKPSAKREQKKEPDALNDDDALDDTQPDSDEKGLGGKIDLTA